MSKPQKTDDKRITPAFRAQAGKGRPKGVPNKTTAAVKDMILQALSNKGGVKYLEEQAEKNPTAFLQLVGKVIPLDVNATVREVPAYTVDDWVIPADADTHQVGHA